MAEKAKVDAQDTEPTSRASVRQSISPLLTITEVAAALSVSKQWLKYWLISNPVDTEGLPFYLPIGRRWKFERQDVDRILLHMRMCESARLGLSIKSKVRLVGLLSKIGDPAQLLKTPGLPVNPPHYHSPADTKLLADLAVSSVLGPRKRPKPPQRRVRLPRAKPPTTE
jgi:excisionase family DNA binding protein